MNTLSPKTLPAQLRAVRLYEYVVAKHAQFTPAAALAIVEQLEPRWSEPIHDLVYHVRAALAEQGVTLAHETGLQAAARIQGYANYFQVPRPAALEVVLLADHGESRLVRDWSECGRMLADSTQRWLQAHRDCRLLTLEVTPNALTIYSMQPDRFNAEGGTRTLAVVRPLLAGEWLAGASQAVEGVRRRVEETGRAMVDGLALVRYCSMRPKAALPYSLWGEVQPSDAPYAELVLMRQDHELDTGYEIVRGNELACWQQLMLDLDGLPPAEISVDDVGAWMCGAARYAWEVATLRMHDVVPGLTRSNLPADESRLLLRRFQASLRMQDPALMRGAARKHIASIDEPPAQYRLDAHRVLRVLNERGETWEDFCAMIGVPGTSPTQPVDVGLFLSLAAHLEHPDPATLLARPTRSELVAVSDDHLLRALIPRAHHVRYRAPAALDAQRRAAIEDAVGDLAASIAIRNGLFAVEPALPDAVYATDGEDLRLRLAELGLHLHVGLLPYLKQIPEEIRREHPQMAPYAFGHSLFLDIDIAPPARATAI